MGKISKKLSGRQESVGQDNGRFVPGTENADPACLLRDDPARVLVEAETGNVQEFLRILNADPSIFYICDSKGRTASHYAAFNNHVEILKIIAQNKGCLDDPDDDGNTPLHLAVNTEAVDSIDFLLQNGVDPNVINETSHSALHLAAESGKAVALKAMSKYANLLDANLPGARGRTPLHLACIHNHFECVKILESYTMDIDLQASPHRACAHSFLPVHEAAKLSSVSALESLLTSGEKCGYQREEMMSRPDNDGNVALHFAVQSGDINTVQICLESGSNITTARKDLSTAVHLACAQGSTEIVKYMFVMQPEEVGHCLKSYDFEQMVPLHYASMFGHVEIVKFLASQGSNLNLLDKNDCTPLLLAASKNAWKSSKLLILAGADFTIRDKNGRTVLHTFAKHHGDLSKVVDEDVALRLLPILDVQDRMGNTALHTAVANGQTQSASVLLKMGAKITVRNLDGDNVLHVACRHGRLKILETILKHLDFSFVLNDSNRKGWIAFHVAAYEGHLKVLQALLQHGTFLRKDYEGRTALHLAAQNGHKEVASLLINANSDFIDTADSHGNTPLHIAAMFNQPKVAELLLRRNCQLTYNNEGESAIDFAIENKFTEVAYVMVAHKNRGDEVLSLSEGKHKCIMETLVAKMPSVTKAVLDNGIQKCTTETPDSPNYHVEYSFKWLAKSSNKSSHAYLPILNDMVDHERSRLLSHELSVKYLLMKWNMYGKYFQFANLFCYFIYLSMVTSITTSLATKEDNFVFRQIWFSQVFNESDTSTYVHEVFLSYQERLTLVLNYLRENEIPISSRTVFVILHIVTVVTAVNMLMETINICRHGRKYCQNIDTWTWIVMSTSVFLASFFQLSAAYTPLQGSSVNLQNLSSAIACFTGWYYLLLILQRFDAVGLYVSMFLEIQKTLLRALVVFAVLILAFAFAFYVLLSNGNHTAFSSMPISIMQTLMMVMGELDFKGTFLNPYVCETLDTTNKTDTRLYASLDECSQPRRIPHPYTTFIFLCVFMIFMPIVMLNLLLGLAVGDIEKVRKNAALNRLSMQVQMYTNIEKSLPSFILKRFNRSSFVDYPNAKTTSIFDKIAMFFQQEEKKDEEEDMSVDSDDLVETILDNNATLGQLTTEMDNMKEMMQLICTKMNINVDFNADEGPSTGTISPLHDLGQSSEKDYVTSVIRRPKLQWCYSVDSNN